jgi:hypothetical protein
MSRTNPQALRVRVAAYVVALLFIVADQWTKEFAVDSLANSVHPMVVAGDGSSTVHALFAARGVAMAEIDGAIERRSLWRLNPAVASTCKRRPLRSAVSWSRCAALACRHRDVCVSIRAKRV